MTETLLTEDNISDLLWLVDMYGHKLTEYHEHIGVDEVKKLSQTLETILNQLG
jgi:hypothetical protein